LLELLSLAAIKRSLRKDDFYIERLPLTDKSCGTKGVQSRKLSGME
jgi:hypothetical protein